MMEWAIEKGATHYTHWFQPLTGVTAEKHDSFLSVPDENGQGDPEPDGQAAHHGRAGCVLLPLRRSALHTLCPRLYGLGHDVPGFVKEMACGTILCIPTVFVAYSGEALDNKTPLLRSMQSLSQQAVRILHLFGNTQAERVIPSVGAEQEYFIVDREKYLKRRDSSIPAAPCSARPRPRGRSWTISISASSGSASARS